jgi:charged multivesicular body protein 2A
MMQAMKGATMALGSMNKTMNLPSLQRIAMEFERENDVMEQRQEMMDDAIDDAMDVGAEEEGDEVVEQVLEEIGVDLSQAVSPSFTVPQSMECCVLISRSSGIRLKGSRQQQFPKAG